MTEHIDSEINITVGLLSSLFVFLSLMMSVPSDTRLFNETRTFLLPFYVKAVFLNKAIESFLFLSFAFLIGAIIAYMFYASHIYGDKPDLYFRNMGLFSFWIGFYYWIELFVCIAILFVLKYFGEQGLADIAMPYMFIISFGTIIIQFYLLSRFLPFQDMSVHISKRGEGVPLNMVVSISHMFFWVLIWVDILKFWHSDFSIMMALDLQFGSVFWFLAGFYFLKGIMESLEKNKIISRVYDFVVRVIQSHILARR